MKISVCIPVYKVHPYYLKDAVRSVLSQEGQFDLEVIINDDVSGVDYQPVLNEINDSRIHYHVNEENLGMVRNWNEAVRLSNGDLVLLLGHDDRIEQGMFREYLKEFEKDPEVMICSCHRRFIDGHGNEALLKRQVNDRKNIFNKGELFSLDGKGVAMLCLRNGNAIGEPSAVMFRRSAFDTIQGYDENFHHAADLDLNIRLSALGQIVYFNQPFLLRRIHKQNLTKSNFMSGKISRDRQKLFACHTRGKNFTKSNISSFKAYLVVTSIYDFFRAIYAGKWRLAILAAKGIMGYVELAPKTYIHYAKEILTGKNADAM